MPLPFPTFRCLTVSAGIFLLGLSSSTAAVDPAVLINPAAAATSETAVPEKDKDELTVESVALRRTAVQKEIATARAELVRLPEGKLDDTALWLTQEAALLERIDNVHAEQQRTLQHAADLAKEAAEVDERTKSRRPPEAILKPPYGMQLLDQLYAERDYLEQAKGWLKTDVENTAEALSDAKQTLSEKDRARRTLREALEKSDDRAKTQGELRLVELESRLVQEEVRLREKALRTLKFQQSLLEPKLALLVPTFEWLRQHLVLSETEVTAARLLREKSASELETSFAQARDQAAEASRLVIIAERAPLEAGKTGELESRRADRQTANLILAVLIAQRQRLDETEKVMEKRRGVLGGGSPPAELKPWAESNRTALETLAKERRSHLAELMKSRRESQELQGKLLRTNTPGEAPAPSPWLVDRVRLLAAWLTLGNQEMAGLDQLRDQRLRLKEELGQRVSSFSWGETLTGAKERLLAGWNYEVTSVQDQPVRVKTILAFILLLWFGQVVSRKISALVGRIMLKRMGMNSGRCAAWQTLTFYALFLIVVLTAFSLFHLSLTQFSVVSGALAIAIGFGSQNLISNFISGIILLMERPVSEGDVIEIDGRQVTVQKVGPRSTIVRSADNTHIIVPNSRLLEQPVTNWTLSDDIVRQKIRVGVAYSSPTREVHRVLLEAMKGLDTVKPEPPPDVIFQDFGDSVLTFEAVFWCSVNERRQADSELRHRINEAFATAGIVMAYPQRDLHLSTTQPLQVEVISRPREPK